MATEPPEQRGRRNLVFLGDPIARLQAPHSQTELSVVSRWLAVAKLVEIRSVLGAVDPEARETEERERVEDQEHRDSYE